MGGTRTFAVALAAGVVLLLVASVAPASQSRASDATVNVTVTAKDYSFSLSTKTAAVGKVAFSVKNSGKKDHNFQVNGKKTSAIKPGKTVKLTVTFGKAGSFTYQSTIADDAKKGMKGTFTSKDVSAGKKVFVSTGCGACHVMKAAGTTGAIGPNLDKSKASRSTIENVVTKGKGVMQPYTSTLSAKQIDQVSDFVLYARTG